jgi:hypothetical protein
MNHNRNFLVGEVIGLLEDSVFHYEIKTNYNIIAEPTEDCLYRHVLDSFPGYKANSFTIYRKLNKQYLSMTLKIDDDIILNEEKLDKLATIRNMNSCFINNIEMISDGKLIIPSSFEDSVYIEDPANPCDFVDSIDVEFIFHDVDNKILLEYIRVI